MNAFGDSLLIKPDGVEIDENILLTKDAQIINWSRFKEELYGPHIPDTETKTCTTDKRNLSDIQSAVTVMHNMLNYVETDKFSKQISLIHEMLLCTSDIISSKLLGEILYLEGLMYFYQGNETLAINAFQRSLSINTELSWNDAFDPSGKELFDKAQQTLKITNPTIVDIHSQNAVYIDGQKYKTNTRLYPGYHIAQTVDTQQVEKTIGFFVLSDQKINILNYARSIYDKDVEEILTKQIYRDDILLYIKDIYPDDTLVFAFPSEETPVIWEVENGTSMRVAEPTIQSKNSDKQKRLILLCLVGTTGITYGGSFYAQHLFTTATTQEQSKIFWVTTNTVSGISMALGISTIIFYWRHK